jgi:large subunit ribosomal protein L25
MNQEGSPAVKTQGAVLTHVMNELEVACLPGKLPEFLEVDLSTIEAGQSVHANDVKLPEGVEPVQHLALENPVIVSATIPAGAVADQEAEAKPDAGATPAA